jgi:predicted alpha/beta superfamily hydrolase
MRKDTMPLIKIIDHDYLIPQLKRRRRVAALLPHDYYTSGKYYPVLYLNDGQNLFDDYAPFGNWGVDDALADLADIGLDMIVIAIDHGGKDRIKEYLPYDNPEYTDKQGQFYIDWIMNDLKPYVDAHFRVKTERKHTGIGGSSMGGLISLFAGFNYNHIFGNLMIFSPSIWISNQVYIHAQSFKIHGDTKFYLYCGGQESGSLKDSMDQLNSILETRNGQFKIEIKSNYNPEGKHQEYFWGLEFPHALSWLYN